VSCDDNLIAAWNEIARYKTTFYVLAVYFGAVGIRKTHHAVIAGLTADVVSLATAVIVCRLMFP